MALEKELETYKAQLPNLKASEGKFVLIHETDVVSVYDTYEDAVKEGYKHFSLQPFLVKKIESNEQVHFVTRLMRVACVL